MPKSNMISLRSESEYKCIDLDDLVSVCVDDYLSTFHCKKGQKFSCTKSLKEVASNLPINFFRINRNCIVNVLALDTLNIHNRTVLLSNSSKFMVSHRRIKQLLLLIAILNITRIIN